MPKPRAEPRTLRLTLLAPAKINWTLEVLRRRPDGFHEIDTVMQTISLSDKIEFRRAPDAACKIVCSDKTIPTDERNLIHRAWALLRAEFPGRVGGLRVKLKKRIPHGAGLGGGSSDAAAALMAIDRLFGLRLSRRRLAALGAKLGSDVAFFIYGGAARCRGRGERIAPIRPANKMKPPVPLAIAWVEGFRSPTAAAYALLQKTDLGSRGASRRAEQAIKRGDGAALVASMRNAFDRPLIAAAPRYALIKTAMAAHGIELKILAGSGAACVGIAARGKAPRSPRASAKLRVVRAAPLGAGARMKAS